MLTVYEGYNAVYRRENNIMIIKEGLLDIFGRRVYIAMDTDALIINLVINLPTFFRFELHVIYTVKFWMWERYYHKSQSVELKIPAAMSYELSFRVRDLSEHVCKLR